MFINYLCYYHLEVNLFYLFGFFLFLALAKRIRKKDN